MWKNRIKTNNNRELMAPPGPSDKYALHVAGIRGIRPGIRVGDNVAPAFIHSLNADN